MAKPKKGDDAVDLAIVFGPKPKGGKKPPVGAGMDDDMAEADDHEEEAELPPDFESYALEAFPELEGDTARTTALWKAVQACVKAG